MGRCCPTSPTLLRRGAPSTAPRGPHPYAIALSLAAVYVIWGSTYLVLRFVVHGLPPLLAGGARYLVAGALLGGVLWLRGKSLPTAWEWLYSLPVGSLMFLGGNGLVSLAEQGVASSMAALVCATTPLFAAGLGRIAGERTTLREWLGLGIGFSGVVVMSLGDLRATPLGTLMLVGASICWALGSLAARRLPLPQGLWSAATQMLTGGMVLCFAGLARGETLPTSAPVESILGLIYLVVFGSLVAFSAYIYLLRATTPAVAMSYAYVNPVLAVLMGTLLGEEALGASTFVAGALVLVGVVVLVSKPRSKPD